MPLTWGGVEKCLGSPDPNKVPELSQVDRRSVVTLQEPGNPERRYITKSRRELGSKSSGENGAPYTLIFRRRVDNGGDELSDGGEGGEDDEIVENREGVEVLDDVPFSGRLRDVSRFDASTTEENGKQDVEKIRDSRSGDTLHGGPPDRVGVELFLKGRPDQAEIGQAGQKDGHQAIGDNPDHRQQGYPEPINKSLPSSLRLGQLQIFPDNVLRSRGQFDVRPTRVLLARRVRDRMSLRDTIIADKPVWHRLTLIDIFSRLLDLILETTDAVCEVLNRIHGLVRSISVIVIRRLQCRSIGWELMRVLEIFCQNRFKSADSLVVIFNEFFEAGNITTDGAPRYSRCRTGFIRDLIQAVVVAVRVGNLGYLDQMAG